MANPNLNPNFPANQAPNVGGSVGSTSAPSASGTPASSHEGPRESPGASTSSDSPTGGQEMLDRVVRGAHETVDRLAETVAPHVQRLSQGIDQAGNAVHSRADDMRELGDEWTTSLRTTVREHPVAAVVTALAVGVLLARLTS